MLSASSAIAFCQSSPSAAVLTVWPSGTGCLDHVHEWLETSGAEIVHSSAVPLSSSVAELLAVMALYDGEDWLESKSTDPMTGDILKIKALFPDDEMKLRCAQYVLSMK